MRVPDAVAGIATVLLDVISDDLSINSIVLDGRGRAAANALIEQGPTWSSFINNANGIRNLAARMLECNILHG